MSTRRGALHLRLLRKSWTVEKAINDKFGPHGNQALGGLSFRDLPAVRVKRPLRHMRFC